MTAAAASPRFCAECGVSLPAGARFCSACGTAVGAAATAAGAPAAPPRTLREQIPGLAVLGGFLAIGLVLWVGVLRSGGPERTAPRPPGPPGGGAAGAAAGGEGMPADHPPIGLTEDAKRFLDQLTAKAEAAPADLEAWKNLAQVQARAAALDPAYGPRAAASFRHVLNLAPEDAETVRSLANVLYDQRLYAEAAAQYERYLELEPDDPNVRTDLGTTYLYQQKIDEALATYRAVLAKEPDFLQAHFNLGLALEAKGDHESAQAALARARALARDDATRERIDRVAAELEGWQPPPAAGAGAAVAGGPPPGGPAGSVPPAGPDTAVPPAADYRGALEQALRAHSILGPRIAAIEWPDDATARVLVRDFPMDRMPEGPRSLFRGRLETMIYDAKEGRGVAGERTIEIVDAANGNVMERATQ